MKFIKKAKIETDDFWYDLFEGGYIKPETLLESGEDIKKVRDAITLLREFKGHAEKQKVLKYH
jgi:hypothetical protein